MRNLLLSLSLLLSAFFFGCQEEEMISKNTNSKFSSADAQMMQGQSGFPIMRVFTAELSSLNNSGVSGTAKLVIDGNTLMVYLDAEGLVPNELHPQHIHGFRENKGNATCPPPSADTNGDGLVSVGEGAPFYGPVLLSLAPFTLAPGGTIDYEQSFSLGEGSLISYEALKPLQNRVIVVHGAFVETENEEGQIVETYVASLPVACGQIMPALASGY